MPKADASPPHVFAAHLADLLHEEAVAAHRLLLDPLAPLVADVERSVRAQGLAPLPRAEGAAYRHSASAREHGAAIAGRLDRRG
jgi:hypothetical protein